MLYKLILPASSMARLQLHTVAIELLPQLSVISDSALIVYGKSFAEGLYSIYVHMFVYTINKGCIMPYRVKHLYIRKSTCISDLK